MLVKEKRKIRERNKDDYISNWGNYNPDELAVARVMGIKQGMVRNREFHERFKTGYD